MKKSLWMIVVGVVWVALGITGDAGSRVSADQGVNALGGTWTTFAHGNNVWALAREGATLWAGAYAGGAVAWAVGAAPGAEPAYTQYLAPQTGLAGNEVRDMVIDRAGNRWLATERGLSRLDPHGGWTTYTVENTQGGLPSNNLTALAVDTIGRLWVGAAQDRRLARVGECDGPATPEGGPNLYCDGMVYFGGGVARFDGLTWATWIAPPQVFRQTTSQVIAGNITDLAVDPQTGEVWATAWPSWRWTLPDRALRGPTAQGAWGLDGAGGISVFNPTTEGWSHYQHDPDRDPPGQPAWPKLNAVTVLTIAPDGRKWFGVYGRGIQTLKDEVWTEFEATGNELLDDLILALALDTQGRVWVAPASAAGVGRGLARLDPNGTPTERRDDHWVGWRTELSGQTIRAILPDGAGVWLGYSDRRGNGAGIDFFRDGRVVTTLRTAGPPSNNITALAVQDSDVWVGTGRRDGVLYGAGLGVRRATGAWETYSPRFVRAGQLGVVAAARNPADSEVRLSGVNGCETLSLRHGVLIGDDPQPYTVTFSFPQDNTCALILDQGLRLALPTGLPVYIAGLTLASAHVSGIAFDPVGRPWIAAQAETVDNLTRALRDGGLSLLERDQWTTYTASLDEPGLPYNAVSSVLVRRPACTGSPEVWVGLGSAALLTGEGVAVLNPTAQTWTHLDRTGMSAPNVSVLAEDRQSCDVWAATTPYRDDRGSVVGGGLSRWLAADRRWLAYDTTNTPSLTALDDAFYAILPDRIGRVWAGAASHHTVGFEPGSTRPCWVCAPPWVRFQGHTDAALNVQIDGVWTDAQRWEYQGAVAALAEDGAGRIWVGLSRGWLSDDIVSPDVAYTRPLVPGGIRVRTTKWLTIDPLNSSMPDGNIQTIAAAEDGTVWLGTVNHGLLRWQPDPDTSATPTPSPTRTPPPTATPTSTPRPEKKLFLPNIVRSPG